MVQPSSEIRQHAVQPARVLGTNVVRLPQVALPLGRFLGEDVAAVGMACLVLAGSGLPEALGRAPMRLDLGHCDVLEGVLRLARAVAIGTGSAATLSILPLPACKSLIPKRIRTGPGHTHTIPANRVGHYDGSGIALQIICLGGRPPPG